MSLLTEAQRRALGDFLRTHRARLTPASLGLPAGSRRRTPGLRREEVAQAAGMSATWYAWLEQGRDVSASPAALAQLARALRLTPAERAYLFELAARRDPAAPDARADGMDVPPEVARAVASVRDPAYLLDRAWTARAWNRAAARLFVGWLDGDGARDDAAAGDRNLDRNLLRYIFLAPAARRLIPDWETRARRVVAELRAGTGRHLEDPALQSLIAALRRQSPVFARAWRAHDVLDRAGGQRRFTHPEDGPLVFEQVAFALASRPDFTLVVLVPQAAPEKPPGRRRASSR